MSIRKVAILRTKLAEAQAEIERLKEWKSSVSQAVKALPEFHTGEWYGDKDGWGYHFEVIRWMAREIAALRSQLMEAREALQAIADWKFDFMGDCVADARRVANDWLAANREGK